ncbi:hypothetical protein [Protaetiibacter mangrovi]|uniref:Integral membrane protein n=1 Tax=Protaetiibacter mangrovi TaxID=2970926 RepID=A0ABT1ZD43_9MICO|nr:hypothetical protein [Protaetiibacter mangrovi]MCS0498621.1 hypothetical protein [Protaetiibacter mangrovi]TPX04996.1 hypothetical protein FJ656_08915 [Schumannella luteola]
MSEPTPPPERPRHPERVAGIFVAVSWAALVFAVFGAIAVLLDRDPVEQSVSPYFGPVTILLGMGVVYLGIVLTVPARTPWLGALATAAGVYLVTLAAAAVVDISLALAEAVSPFLLAAAALAAAPPIGCWAYFRR